MTTKVYLVLITLVLSLCVSFEAHSQSTYPADYPDPIQLHLTSQTQAHKAKGRPTIGLVLGGGGAKGLAHVGVIKVLEQNQIPVDVVAGTSMGAIVGALYASGYSADEIDDIALTLDWQDVFNDDTARSRETFRRKSDEFGFLTDYKVTFRDGKIVLPQGVIQGQNLFLELSRLLAGTRSVASYDKLPIPLRLVATDLQTGDPVVIDDGDLATAVFASMAIPGFVPPVERDGTLLVDGGIVNNLPIDIAREMGADIVIVVNVGSDAKNVDDLGNFLDVLRQTQLLLTQKNTLAQLNTLTNRDVLIVPSMDGMGVASFTATPAIVQRGEVAASKMIDKLSPLALSRRDWVKHLQGRVALPQIQPVISSIRIQNASGLSDKIIRYGITQKIGDEFSPDQINHDIARIYGAGVFDRITYRLIPQDGGSVLEINARAKESSDGYFRFGITLDSDLEDDSTFQLGVSYTKPQINKWGGEWRTEVLLGDDVRTKTELYQPLGAAQRFFIEPSLYVNNITEDYYPTSGVQQGEFEVFYYGAQLHGGLNLGRWGELRTGTAVSQATIDFSDPEIDPQRLNRQDRMMMARFNVDTLDSLYFPKTGNYFLMEYQYHGDFLGGDTSFDQFKLEAFKPVAFGRHRLSLGLHMTSASGDDSNTLGVSNLGGFLTLSGFTENELTGRASALLVGSYLYRITETAALFDTPVFVGGSLETGNVYDGFSDINFGDAIFAGSVFTGMQSPIGPVFLGFGTNDTGAASFYFSIGSFF